MLLFHIWNSFFFSERGAYVGMHAYTHIRTSCWCCSNNSHCFSIWMGNWDRVSTSQVFLKMCKWKRQWCEPGLNTSFRLGWVSELTLQSPVTFNYHYDSASWSASQPVSSPACLVQPGATAEQSRLGDQSFDVLRDSSRTAVWGLHQLSFLAPDSGARNIQHISYTANIFWTVPEPVKIHSFPGLEPGLHPGLLDNLWKKKERRKEGKREV